MNSQFKQAQRAYDERLPEDQSELEDLIQSLTEELIEYGVVKHPALRHYVYLGDLDQWCEKNGHSQIIKSKINEYKVLQESLYRAMIQEIIESKGE